MQWLSSRRGRITVLVGVVVAVVVLAMGLLIEPYPVDAHAVFLVESDPNALDIEVGACGGEYLISIEETPSEVWVLVTDTRFPIRLFNQGCADAVHVVLTRPLGARQIVDVSDGLVIPVLR